MLNSDLELTINVDLENDLVSCEVYNYTTQGNLVEDLCKTPAAFIEQTLSTLDTTKIQEINIKIGRRQVKIPVHAQILFRC